MTTKEEAWNAYLSGAFILAVYISPLNIVLPSRLTALFVVPLLSKKSSLVTVYIESTSVLV